MTAAVGIVTWVFLTMIFLGVGLWGANRLYAQRVADKIRGIKRVDPGYVEYITTQRGQNVNDMLARAAIEEAGVHRAQLCESEQRRVAPATSWPTQTQRRSVS